MLALSLATGHPALERVRRLVLTNCESYDKFPPPALKLATRLCRAVPWLVRPLLRLQLRVPTLERRLVFGATASGLDPERRASFFGPARRERGIVADLVAAMAGFHEQLLIDAAEVIPRYDWPVLLVWGDSCDFFPLTDAERLAAEFPDAELVVVPGAKTWVPVDNPGVVAESIARFVPTALPYGSDPGSTAPAQGRRAGPLKAGHPAF